MKKRTLKNCFSRPTCAALAGALLLSLSLTACSSAAQTESSSAQAPDTVTITSLNANQEETELTVPYDPQRIAILDMACLDILDRLGVGDRVVGSASTSLDYLQAYVTDENVSNLGTIKEADLEAVMACEPDVIFIGGRLASSYDALSEIAPVIYLSTDTELGVVESVRKNATTIASLFGLEDQVDELMADFDPGSKLSPHSRKEKPRSSACAPAEASTCSATTAAAPSSAERSALKIWATAM